VIGALSRHSLQDTKVRSSGPSPRLIMMARVPAYGRVKSRLAAHIGPAQALAAHVKLLKYNASIAARSGIPFELHFVGDAQQPFFLALAAAMGASLVPQVDGDIGARMLAAAASSSSPCIIIGSDCGAMSERYLHDAVLALESADVVLGGAEDGGYVLIGQQKPLPGIFSGVEWGTERVAAQTLERASKLGVTVTQLPTLWDVDNVNDWRRFQQLTKAVGEQRPTTS